MSQRLEKKQRDQKKKSLLRYAVLILVLAVAAGLLYRVGQNVLTIYHRQQQETVVVRYGNMEEKLQGEGLILRCETVVNTHSAGYFENMVSDGEKVGRNQLLGYYMSLDHKTAMRATTTGIFTRQLDGLEGALQDVTLSTVGPELFSYQSQRHDPEAEFQPGQGVYKIVNNLLPTQLILQLPGQDLSFSIEKNQIVKLSIDGDAPGECKVVDFKNDFEKLVMIIETEDFREDLLNRRQVDIELFLNLQSGYLVPEKSLLNRGQEKGIYCTKGESIVFRPVSVLATKNGIALVEGLQPNDMVIIKPEKVKL